MHRALGALPYLPMHRSAPVGRGLTGRSLGRLLRGNAKRDTRPSPYKRRTLPSDGQRYLYAGVPCVLRFKELPQFLGGGKPDIFYFFYLINLLGKF